MPGLICVGTDPLVRPASEANVTKTIWEGHEFSRAVKVR